MTFTADLAAFVKKVEARQKDVFVGTVNDVRTSVVEGSPVTSAPGQPVDTGTLRASWRESFPEQWVGEVASYNVVYAEYIEDGMGKNGPLTLRSEVGGFHSRKLTIANFNRLVNHVVTRVVGND